MTGSGSRCLTLAVRQCSHSVAFRSAGRKVWLTVAAATCRLLTALPEGEN